MTSIVHPSFEPLANGTTPADFNLPAAALISFQVDGGAILLADKMSGL